MDKRIEEYWVEKYPKLFAGYHLGIYKSPMAWGFTCGEGWFNILDQLWKDLDQIGEVVLAQVKEKFGGLRVYTASVGFLSPDEHTRVRALIAEATSKSFKTCEVCGKPGELRSGGWLFTHCDDCKGLDRDARWAVNEQVANKIITELGIK